MNSGPSEYDCTLPMGISQLSFYYLLTTSAVVVNFNENNYTVAESDIMANYWMSNFDDITNYKTTDFGN